MDNLVKQYLKIPEIVNKLGNHLKELLEEEKKTIVFDPSLLNTRQNQNDFDIYTIKSLFGKLFYGVLCPINGVNPKNKRYPDGSSVITSNNARESGACVWKKIGVKNRWSSKAKWYSERQIYDNLSQDHIDLVINGTINRKDQIARATDLLQFRDKLEAEFHKLNNIQNKKELSKPYTVKMLILANARLPIPKDPTLCINFNLNLNSKFPVACFDVTVKTASLSGSDLSFNFEIDQKEVTMLKNVFNIERGYNYYSNFNINLLNSSAQVPAGSYSYYDSYCILNAGQLLNDPVIKSFFTAGNDIENEIIKIWDELQAKYNPILLANGIF